MLYSKENYEVISCEVSLEDMAYASYPKYSDLCFLDIDVACAITVIVPLDAHAFHTKTVYLTPDTKGSELVRAFEDFVEEPSRVAILIDKKDDRMNPFISMSLSYLLHTVFTHKNNLLAYSFTEIAAHL